MHMLEGLKEDWDVFWDSGDRDFNRRITFNLNSHQGRLTLQILKSRKKNERILEAGCGVGYWLFLFEALGFDSFGVDISAIALRKAAALVRKDKESIRLFQGDIRHLPINNRMFDIVVSYVAIEHFIETKSAVVDFFRVTKPGGICFVTTPNPFSFHRLLGYRIVNLLKDKKLGYVGYENAYTPRQLETMLKEAGFRRVECGILSEGMGYLFGEFWPSIPFVGRHVFNLLVKISRVIESRQKVIGGGSFAIGYK